MGKPRQIHYTLSTSKIAFNQITLFLTGKPPRARLRSNAYDSTNPLTRVRAKTQRGIKVHCLKNQAGVWSVLLNQGEGMRMDLLTHIHVITLVQKCQRGGRRSNH